MIRLTPTSTLFPYTTLFRSGSMVSTDISPNRLAAAEQAARNFVQALPRGIQVGLVSFSTGANMAVAPTTDRTALDRKSTRLNSSHVEISYAVFCLKKKNHSN